MGTFNAGSIEASLTLDRSQFVRELKAAREQARRFEQKDINVDLKIDDGGQIATLKALLDSVKDKITIDADVDPAIKKIMLLDDLIQFIDPYQITVKADTAKAEIEVDYLKAKLARLDKTINVRVNERNTDAIENLGGAVGRTTGRMQQWQAILLAILTFIPILAGSIGILAGGIMALLASVSAAAGGAILLAVGLSAIWKEASKIKNATGDVKKFQDAVQELKDSWQGFLDKIRPAALKVLTKGLNLMADVVDKLAPVFNAFAEQAVDALDGLAKWFNSGPGQDMLFWFEHFGADQFGTLLRILGNLSQVVLNLLYAFSPLADVMMRGFEGITEKWLEWSQNVQNSKGFQDFVAYIIENAPKMFDMLGSLVDAFINIGIAVAPLAGPMLDGLTAVFDFIANLDPQILGAIVAGVTGLWLAFQGVSAAMGIIGVIMAGGWVAVIVAAIVAVAAVVIYLWHSSEGFRDFVTAAWPAIQATVVGAVSAIVNYIREVWPAIQTIVTTVFNALRPYLTVWFNGVVAAFKIFGAVISTVFKVTFTMLSAIVRAVAAIMKGDWSGAMQIMRTSAVTILNAIKNLFVSIFNAIKGFVTGSVGSIKTIAVNGFNNMKNLVVAAFRAMLSLITGQVTRTVSVVRGMASAIRGVFAGAAGWLRNAGANIVNGLISGIRSKIGEVRAQLNQLTNMIPDWKGPMDVDRKLLTPNGAAIMESLMAGVDALMPKVERKFGTVTDMIRGVGTGGASGGGGTMAPAAAPGTNVTFYVYNPVAEKSSVTATREASGLVSLGVLG